MTDVFHSQRFDKKVWLTNHAIESMAKRNITLNEIKTLIEEGLFEIKEYPHGWIFHHFAARIDNLVCAAIVDQQAIVIKTVMINWKIRGSS